MIIFHPKCRAIILDFLNNVMTLLVFYLHWLVEKVRTFGEGYHPIGFLPLLISKECYSFWRRLWSYWFSTFIDLEKVRVFGQGYNESYYLIGFRSPLNHIESYDLIGFLSLLTSRECQRVWRNHNEGYHHIGFPSLWNSEGQYWFSKRSSDQDHHKQIIYFGN
jgi:hypothetical protein